MSGISLKNKISASIQSGSFNPYRLISDEEFQKNLTAILTYYHMLKKESKRRFVSHNLDQKQLLAS